MEFCATAPAQAYQRDKVLYAIDPKKDVDAFHPVNVGKLMIGRGRTISPARRPGFSNSSSAQGAKIDGGESGCLGGRTSVAKTIANIVALQKQKGKSERDP